MQASPRNRVFGAKPSATPTRRPVSVTLQPAELHHSTGKLTTWALISGVFVVAALWTMTSGGIGADYHGRDAFLFHLMGPQGTMLFFGLFGLGCAVLGAAYLRLLCTADRLAARAGPAGLTVNGVWGRKSYEWRDVVGIGLHITRARSKEVAFIRIDRFDGGKQLVSINTVEGGRAVAEQWIVEAQGFLHR